MANHRGEVRTGTVQRLNELCLYWKIVFTITGFIALIMVLGIISSLTT